MGNQISTFESEWESILYPFKGAMFHGAHDLLGFDCFYSKLEDFEQGRYYCLYDIPYLMRLLLKKEQIISDELEEGLYSTDGDIICRVLEWDRHLKKILLVQIDPIEVLDPDLFSEKMSDMDSLIYQYDEILKLSRGYF